jgi:hypothetical protein
MEKTPPFLSARKLLLTQPEEASERRGDFHAMVGIPDRRRQRVSQA